MEYFPETALKIYKAIFEDRDEVEVNDVVYPITATSKSDLRNVRVGDLLFIEQNPAKSSHWAKMAQEGHKILWVMKGRRYLAQVRDGMFHDFRKEQVISWVLHRFGSWQSLLESTDSLDARTSNVLVMSDSASLLKSLGE